MSRFPERPQMQKKQIVGRAVTTAVVVLLGMHLTGCGEKKSSENSAPSSTSASSSPTTSSTPSTSTTSKPSIEPGTIPGTGRFQVGVDIQPGTYVSETDPGTMCYAARLTAKDSPDPLITNHVTKGRTVVTIQKTDAFFETRDCATWKKR
ncbi:hypothetical protein SAMN05421595_0826 [Austwickia chelonae]|nr:hypothetical protein [Austwickia chelonae]SEW00969.1 hypothetical protein SAMN05421595_0826 [Austwickia chelonae]